MGRQIDIDRLASQIIAGSRGALARGITLAESTRPRDALLSDELLQKLPAKPNSIRVGISGVPGAGKSTFIETLGMYLVERGHRVAVLAIDPSSERSGGSVLGDKTRMQRLSIDERAYVRPSPTRGTLGGVSARTFEAIRVCEGAGYDIVLVETVGVGQSETVVADLVDVTMALFVAGAGDSLQGIKRGILEVIDLLVINKADSVGEERALQAAAEYRGALRLMRGQAIPVMAMSGLTGSGVAEVWQTTLERHGSASVAEVRALQRTRHFERALVEELSALARETEKHAEMTTSVTAGTLSPRAAARALRDQLVAST